jgi:pimeloyl-ACP methyl ester carboxylesterase
MTGPPMTGPPMTEPPQFSFVPTNGIRLHVAGAGREDGPLVILLHGFPEFWYGWRHQIGPLAEAGYRVLAPDQRGYNLSDKPEAVASYALDRLAADVVGLIDAAGRPTATVVGHDWGGIVAWWLALRHPGRLERIVVLNAPHPEAFRRYLVRHPGQMLRSWYALAFQLPWLPEAGLRRRNWRGLVRAMQRTSRPGTFTDEDFGRYRRAWSEPRAITTMIHWYRAAVRARPRLPEDVRIRVPALLIWGARDRFMDRGLARTSLDACDDGRLELIEEATHWVQHEEPGRVNRLLLDFLAGATPPDPGGARAPGT